MAEHVADYEWRGEGDEAEVVLYAADSSAFERALFAARLPGVESPVYAAASESGFGWVAASTESVAPDLASVPVRGMLLTSDEPVGGLGVRPEDVAPMILRKLAEVGIPALGAAGVRRVCGVGARAAAEDELIEEEDLPFFGSRSGEPDSLDRRAITTGSRSWEERLGSEIDVYVVGEPFDAERVEEAGIGPGALAIRVRAGSGDLGRLAVSAHRERILRRVWSGEFELDQDLPVAPVGSEEAVDLLAALRSAENFADGRAALLLYALRRALRDMGSDLRIRASWGVGGIEEREGSFVHRRGLATLGEGEVLVAGSSVAAGTGKMWGSVPPFGVEEDEGRWPWEEAGLLERLAGLKAPGG
ncbi:MAG TPA: hypothetical protein VFJ72_07915 [Rubrobacteraceae bacterium]|nr:hypothetical protein [Rubrobacteraceae bacterium]